MQKRRMVGNVEGMRTIEGYDWVIGLSVLYGVIVPQMVEKGGLKAKYNYSSERTGLNEEHKLCSS